MAAVVAAVAAKVACPLDPPWPPHLDDPAALGFLSRYLVCRRHGRQRRGGGRSGSRRQLRGGLGERSRQCGCDWVGGGCCGGKHELLPEQPAPLLGRERPRLGGSGDGERSSAEERCRRAVHAAQRAREGVPVVQVFLVGEVGVFEGARRRRLERGEQQNGGHAARLAVEREWGDSFVYGADLVVLVRHVDAAVRFDRAAGSRERVFALEPWDGRNRHSLPPLFLLRWRRQVPHQQAPAATQNQCAHARLSQIVRIRAR
mmetsp:Transcript_65643/g.132097  ORF Transcript_65643/g.132097 Transcript_65643/m.132097 type:complete len:259 (+) Transcript_65643:136-912(+)